MPKILVKVYFNIDSEDDNEIDYHFFKSEEEAQIAVEKLLLKFPFFSYEVWDWDSQKIISKRGSDKIISLFDLIE